MEEIRYKKLIPTAKAPFKKFAPDAGWDFFCTEIVRTSKYLEYHTGIAVEIPVGKVGLAFPRSSVTGKDLMLKNCVGVIDATYRGEVIFRFADTKEYTVTQKKEIYEIGERIGQLVFFDIPEIRLIEVDELSETDRGEGGFGHTGA